MKYYISAVILLIAVAGYFYNHPEAWSTLPGPRAVPTATPIPPLIIPPTSPDSYRKLYTGSKPGTDCHYSTRVHPQSYAHTHAGSGVGGTG